MTLHSIKLKLTELTQDRFAGSENFVRKPDVFV